jgi:arylsulfatase
LIIFYPKGIKEKGIRNQYSHIIDIAPTIVDLTGSTVPEVINGYKQKPFEGSSLVYSIKNADAPGQHTIQYNELRGKRSIYKDGWKAEVFHQTGTDFADDVWELYDLNNDFNECIDLAKKNPEKLKELQDLFDHEAQKYNVYPLIDGSQDGGTGQRKRSAFGLANKVVLYPGVDQFLSYSGPQLTNQSFSITAQVDAYSKTDQGVLFATGGDFNGLSLFIKDGKFQSAHNTGTQIKYLESKLLPTGKLTLRFELHYITPKIDASADKKSRANSNANAGTESIYVNDVKIAERDIVAGEIRYIGGYIDAIDVGQDLNSAVADRYKTPFKFTGDLKNVTIEYK